MDPDWLRRGAVGPEAAIDEGCLITEIVNAADCPAASLALARLPAGTRTRLHRLVGVEERYVIRCGRGRAEIAGAVADLGPGDIAVIPPGAPQRIEALGAEDLEFYCLCTPRFTPEAYEDLEDT
jgi:mannose-6-phosphate isomerase-like protein (cupin superfamily)